MWILRLHFCHDLYFAMSQMFYSVSRHHRYFRPLADGSFHAGHEAAGHQVRTVLDKGDSPQPGIQYTLIDFLS